MPIYEYICQKCQHPFERLVFADTAVACPECGSQTVDKQFSTFAVGAHAHKESPCESAGLCGTCGNTPGSCAWNDE
jgi:putative FmdB family regulatory protein